MRRRPTGGGGPPRAYSRRQHYRRRAEPPVRPPGRSRRRHEQLHPEPALAPLDDNPWGLVLALTLLVFVAIVVLIFCTQAVFVALQLG